MKIWPWSVIADLRRENEGLMDHIRNLQNIAGKTQAELNIANRAIRDIDEQISKMGQYTDWNQMQPHFNYLHEGTISRKRSESNRINDLLRPELMKTYELRKTLPQGKWINSDNGDKGAD